MAIVSHTYENPNHYISIDVLEPEIGEESFDEGPQVDVNWDNFISLSVSEFEDVCAWMTKVGAHIRDSFDEAGKKKETFMEMV